MLKVIFTETVCKFTNQHGDPPDITTYRRRNSPLISDSGWRSVQNMQFGSLARIFMGYQGSPEEMRVQ